jgi:hypothetical protein
MRVATSRDVRIVYPRLKWLYICVRSVAVVTHQLVELQYDHSEAVAASFVVA